MLSCFRPSSGQMSCVSVSLFALLVSASCTAMAAAQTAPDARRAQAAAPATDEETPADIVVTGTATAQRKFDVSYAVTSLSNADIKQLAPLSFADLLSQVPGILAESTGGEVQNVYRLLWAFNIAAVQPPPNTKFAALGFALNCGEKAGLVQKAAAIV